MLYDGLKLMGIGMITVMLFLILLVVFIELVKFVCWDLLRIKTPIPKELGKTNNLLKNNSMQEVPVEILLSAVIAYESDNQLRNSDYYD